jgi:antitoxin component of RelBE/YafQ-DinJ toxin-antitoxin module
MSQVQFATRVDTRIKRAVEKVCEARGLKLQHFVEEALLDKLEELDDIEDVKRIRFEATKSLAAVLKKLKLDDKL